MRSLVLSLGAALFAVVGWVATAPAARAEDIQVFNYAPQKPTTLYVAEYRLDTFGAKTRGDVVRVGSVRRIEVADSVTWTKARAESGYERWAVWHHSEGMLTSAFSESAWKSHGWKKHIGDIGRIYLSDEGSPGDYRGLTALTFNWNQAWDAIWDASSSAGTTVEVENASDKALVATEWQKKPSGKARKLQTVTVAAGAAVGIKRSNMAAGYTERFLITTTSGGWAATHDEILVSYWKPGTETKSIMLPRSHVIVALDDAGNVVSYYPGDVPTETVTVRNKLIHRPDVIWVAEYRENTSTGVASRANGPFRLEPDDEKTWTKSKGDGPYRWMRWSHAEDQFPAEYSRKEWNGLAWRERISVGKRTCNITDYFKVGEERSYTDTGVTLRFVGQAWADEWSKVWDVLSTAGTVVTITNETKVDQYVCEYMKKTLGQGKKLQGGTTGVKIAPGASHRLTKAKLAPGYPGRFVWFKPVSVDGRPPVFPDTADHSTLHALGPATEGDGASIKDLHLFVTSDGLPRAYSGSEWDFKQLACQVLVGAINTASKAGSHVELPPDVIRMLGIDLLMKPLEDAVAKVATDAIDLTELKAQLDARLGESFSTENITVMKNLADKVGTKGYADLFDAAIFCSGDKKRILGELRRLGMEVPAWAGLVPADRANRKWFHQGFSMTAGVAYKNLIIAIQTSIITDFKDDFGVFHSLSVGLGTSSERIPKIMRVPSVEFYPHSSMTETFPGFSWSFGVSGNLRGLPSGGFSAIFPVTSTRLPDFSQLTGVSLSVSKGDSKTSFGASGALGWSGESK